jgi:hypothetical protein
MTGILTAKGIIADNTAKIGLSSINTSTGDLLISMMLVIN